MRELITDIPILSSKSAFRRSVVIASDSEAISSFWGLLRRYLYDAIRCVTACVMTCVTVEV